MFPNGGAIAYATEQGQFGLFDVGSHACVSRVTATLTYLYPKPKPEPERWSPETATTPMPNRVYYPFNRESVYSPARAAITYSHPHMTTRTLAACIATLHYL